MIDVSVTALVKPTEKVDRVTSAIEKIFPGLIMDIREDRIQAYDGIASLTRFHMLLREELILDTARKVMMKGLAGDSVQFRLSKQAAYMGRVSFPPEEEPLGSIHVQISGDDRIIDWLAPMTENGIPVVEIDLLKEFVNV